MSRRLPSPPPPAQPASGRAARRRAAEESARRERRRRRGGPVAIAVRTTAELCLTAGALMLLLAVYQLWYTNVLADRAAGQVTSTLQRQWDTGAPAAPPGGDGAGGTVPAGQGFAVLHIPSLGMESPIAQGVSKTKVLDQGMVGHYDGTGGPASAMPGDKEGNFALAAHRNSHGEPFRRINRLHAGDLVVVETRDTYYTYEITSSLPQTSPSNTAVVRPVPEGSGFTAPGRYLTLTTCTPEFTSTYRLVVWGKLASERPRSQGPPPALTDTHS
ncbi:class E sortase [Streptomyces sp. NPDC059918]|uniref:class E sortase n=1 Tax=unclassified Streptomyces TaxID=2593676 RepID=UPI0036529560